MKRLNDATPQEWDDAYDAIMQKEKTHKELLIENIINNAGEVVFLENPGEITFLETSDGSSANYYKLPPDATELQDLISYKNMNAQIGEIFRECYRYGQSSHSDEMRGIKKILFYAQAELKRLENLAKK